MSNRDTFVAQLAKELGVKPVSIYRYVGPIREEELLDFTAQEWRMLEDGGVTTYDLPGEEVARVFALKREQASSSASA